MLYKHPKLSNDIWARLSVHRIAFLLVVGFGMYYISQLYDYGFIHGDEGLTLMTSWRISMGQLPHRDFFMGIPPFSFLPTALLFKLFGPNFISARILVCIYSALLILAADLVLKQLVQSYWPRFLVAIYLIPYGVLFWRIPSHHWLVGICQLLAIWAIITAIKNKPQRLLRASAAGMFTSLACFTMQDQGGYLLIFLLILFFPFIHDVKTKKIIFVGWVSGGLCTAFLFFVYLLSGASPDEIFYQWFIFPLTRYKMLPGNIGSLTALGWQQIGTQPWLDTFKIFPAYTLSETFFTILIPLLPLVALFVLISAIYHKRLPGWQSGILMAGFLAFTGGCLHRFSQTYLVWAAPMYLIIVGHELDRLATIGIRKWRITAQSTAVTIIIMSFMYGAGYLHMITSQESVTINGRSGKIQVPARSTQSSMQIVLDAIEKHVPAEAPLICTQYNPIINFWTQRKNPTPFDFIITSYNLYTDHHLKEAVNAITDNPDTHVLMFVPINNNNIFDNYVLKNYTPVWRAPWAVLMAPK